MRRDSAAVVGDHHGISRADRGDHPGCDLGPRRFAACVVERECGDEFDVDAVLREHRRNKPSAARAARARGDVDDGDGRLRAEPRRDAVDVLVEKDITDHDDPHRELVPTIASKTTQRTWMNASWHSCT